MWGAVEADFHREYGVDLAAPGLLASRTWRWFVTRLGNLSPDAMTRVMARKQAKNDPHGAMSALAAAARR